MLLREIVHILCSTSIHPYIYISIDFTDIYSVFFVAATNDF